MVWLPSGVYRNHRENNFPSQFVSTWLNWPATSTNRFDQTNGLASISRSGKDFGLWWGNSTKVAMDWDPASLVDFDPDNADHVERALHELDIAAKAGATTIGLDTFSHVHTPIWKGYGWLAAMRLRYPHMRFVTEPSMCDVMHTLAPTFDQRVERRNPAPGRGGSVPRQTPELHRRLSAAGARDLGGGVPVQRAGGVLRQTTEPGTRGRRYQKVQRLRVCWADPINNQRVDRGGGRQELEYNGTERHPSVGGSGRVRPGGGGFVARGVGDGLAGGSWVGRACWAGRPTKPLSRTLPSSKVPSGNDTADVQPSLGPSVQVRSGRVARGTVVVRPRTSPSVVTSDGLSDPGAVRTAVGHPKPRLRMKAFRVSTPTDALSDSIRKERATATEPAEPAAPESEREELSDWDWFQPFLVEVLRDPG